MAEGEASDHVTADESGVVAPWKGTTRYEVLGCLGRGGMGIVYEAFDRQQHERVALKTVLHFDPGTALPLQAGVPDARGRRAPQPRAPARARRQRGRRRLLHDGARRRNGLPRSRAGAPGARSRRMASGPVDHHRHDAPRAEGCSPTGPSRSSWTRRSAALRTPTSRSCAPRSGSSSRACARSTPPASSTATSSRRTSASRRRGASCSSTSASPPS